RFGALRGLGGHPGLRRGDREGHRRLPRRGLRRIKLKIKPGKDIEPVAAVRRAFGDDFGFQVDANAAYTLVDAAHLRRLDDYGLLLIEQPLGEADIRQHAELAKLMDTPMCLDESIVSA